MKQCKADGLPVPDKIKNAPELRPWLQIYWTTFEDLGSCRQVGMAVGPIPWTAINEYGKVYGFTEEQVRLCTWYIRELDTVYLKHLAKDK